MQTAVDALLFAGLAVVGDDLRSEYLNPAIFVYAPARRGLRQLGVDRNTPDVIHRRPRLERCLARVSPWIADLAHKVLMRGSERRGERIEGDAVGEPVE